nr:transferrin-binding protein-like solute binding protein [Alphaproteobacteria bacterium]
MRQYFSIIIASLIFTVILTGCGKRGGGGVVSSGVVTDDVFIADSIKKLETDATFPTVAPYDSLTEAVADTENEDDKIFTLQALAVQGSETTNYTASGDLGWNQDGETIINVATITAPAVSLTFNGDGNMSAVTAYFADKTYEIALDDSDSATQINATIDNGAQSDATIATLTVDRKASFGFDSNYMAYIGWNLERTVGSANRLAALGKGKDRSYDITGNMIAGIETDNINMPSNGDVTFIGKGRGYYSHVSASQKSYATIFDVETAVDFFAKTVEVSSTNTMRCSDKTDMSSCATVADALNFGTQETFIYIIGDKVGFRGDVSLEADNTFTGTIDARFYGGRAQELGSIFAMRDETGGYYYGAFGGERKGVEAPNVFNTTIVDETVTVAEETEIDTAIGENDASYTSLTAVAGATGTNSITMKALTVYKDDTTDYIRAPNRNWVADADTVRGGADTSRAIGITRVSGAAASLTFDNVGNISEATLYTNDENIDKNAATDVKTGSDFFGFDSNYMAHVSWDLEKTKNALDNTPLKVEDNIYNISGAMLAGIETADTAIPLVGDKVEFRGKGRGTYGNFTESYDTIFDVTAIVSFSARHLTLASYNTCKAIDCKNESLINLDFSISSEPIFYNSNNIGNNVSDVNYGSVALDARFYGADAWEFGGTFAITYRHDNSYYYGAFGAVREGIESPSVFNQTIASESVTLPNDVTISTDYVSLTDVADASGTNSITMNALTAYKNDAIIYTRAPNRDWLTHADKVPVTSIVRLAGAAASLNFDEKSNISGVTAYLNGATYTAITADAIDVERGSDFFGFDSNYMAYIGWDLKESEGALAKDSNVLTDSLYDYTGGMLVGIETLASTIPITETREFKGKGRGTYGDTDGSYKTIFDVTASVDFDEKNVTIASTDTCVSTNPNCVASDSEWRSNLNFDTGALSFADGEDSINLINKTDLNINGMIGTLDARFYGAGVSELGGTFALANSSSYYYGVFGAERGGIKTLSFNSTIADKTATLPSNVTISTNHASLTEAVADDVVMNALSVYKDDATTYTRTSEGQSWETDADKAQTISLANLTGSAASLTFDGDNAISGVTLYTNDAPGTNNSATIIGDKSKVERGSGFFGFDSNYMAYISWEIDNDFDDNSTGLTGSVFDIDGAMLAGIETQSIDLSDEVDFKGKGRGTYGDATGSYDTIFDVIAKVNFGNTNNVTIRSLNTCKAFVGADCTDDSDDRVDTLDINTGGINFTANSISANLNVNGLTGTLDARFYGDKTREFGGTFAANNSSSYYYGAFGAERNGITEPITLNPVTDASASDDNTSAITTAIANNGPYNSLADVTSATFTMRGLSVYQDDSTSYERASQNKDWVSKADKAQTVKIARLTGAVASLTFDGGNVSGVTLYTDDADINTTATTIVDRSTIFGFASNDMAYISWGSTQTVADDLDNSATTGTLTNIDGAMLAGIETDTGNILTFGATTFTGKGRGTYGVIDENNVLTGYDTIFDMIASVDFASKTIIISSNNTCRANDCQNQPLSNLDFTTPTDAGNKLSFANGDDAENSISGDVALIENNQFSGRLDARFYGYIGREFGGTFALSDANSYYYGAFGANREALYNTNFTLNQIDGNSNYLVSTPVDSNNDNEYVSLYNAIADTSGTVDRTFIMRALTVSAIDKTNYVRESGEAWNSSDRDKDVTLSRVRDSYASLTIDGSGILSDIEISLGNGFTYTANASSPNSTTLSGNITGTLGLGATTEQTIRLFRDDDLFEFEASDMVFIDWEITEALPMAGTKTNQEKRHGMMIAGLETEFAHIPTANPTGLASARFTGRGNGFYEDIAANTSLQTRVILTANVDFAARKLDIIGSGTAKCTDAATRVGCSTVGMSFLNFKASGITYSSNNISGDVALTANPQFNGRLDARFYGDGGHKFGGTFALNNTDGSKYYYGAFGAQRTTPVTQFKFNETLASESGPESTLDFLITNQTDHDSLHAVAITDGSNSFTMNGLAVYQSN